MDIFDKIAAQGKALLAVVMMEFGKISSPIVKLVMLAVTVVIAFWLVLEALPILLVGGLLVAAYLVIKAIIEGEGTKP
ncbi:hypothetical protein [Sphingobium sp. WCS2017Hpa-17]|uniref:hypothetical protein n=1 Tax=Sphingobium sp. WCS2017Hpa-17 TaxID=3073638 RepID=UPI0028892CD9|nr:hypothetical protein [Sphingobium sp. WCS2017Hpa-17]